MDVKLRPLRYFKAVVEHGTIAAAAQALHVAQPPLSKQIRQLEAEWGVELFERINHRLHLREEGRYLYVHACELLQLADDIDARMQALAAGTSGPIRVGTTAGGIEPVARAIARLNADHADLRFVCWQGEPHTLQAMVDSRTLDVAVVPRPIETPGLQAQALAPLHYVALAPRDSGLDGRVDLATLAQRPLILLHRNSRFGSFERLLDAFYVQGLTPEVVAECSDVPILHALVREGLGVALIAENAAENTALADPQLQRHPITDLAPIDAELVLIRKADVEPGAAVRRFCEQLLKTAAQGTTCD
ncbi:LysR family transcriptional regulator [Salinisphaera aquimarina]|uniref:LysR family transcriptional regulator n=1 Tax=Salinisphaera aquimarina TaxID=2094031 RepID=A0ABV7EKX2_9GAMM